MQIAANGLRFAVVSEGDGPPVTLIHGLGAGLEIWDAIAASLRPRFRVIRYDLRGHGRSAAPPGPTSLDGFTDDLGAILDRLGVARTHMVGFSLGGLIAQSFALAHPHRVDRLVIVSSVANKSAEERARLKQRADEIDREGAAANLDAAVERWFTPAFRDRHPEVVAERVRRFRETDPAALAAAFRVFLEGDLGDRLHEIKAPTLIMTGEHDPISPAHMSRFMHEAIAGSEFAILPGLRHNILLEAPDIVAARIVAFLG